MSVAVYPRLGKLLEAQGISVAELGQRIEQRFGLPVDRGALDQLASTGPVQRPDIQVAGAAAAVLGVGLDAVFDVQTVPVQPDDTPGPVFPAEQSRRLTELLEQQSLRLLTEAEQHELMALVDAWGQSLHEWRLRQIAAQRGLSIPQAREQVATELERALALWHAVEQNPDHRQAIEDAARRRRRRGRAKAQH